PLCGAAQLLSPHARARAGEEAIWWLRTQLLGDQDATLVGERVSFASARLSRADIHIDWQGGYAPSLVNVAEDLRCFIRPGKTTWGCYGSGHQPTGYTFGTGDVKARLYNKSVEATAKANDAYFALLAARNEECYNPALDVWRLEFQLKRDGAKGFRLFAQPEPDDGEAAIEAELSAEELEHLGTLPRFFARMHELFLHLTQHWLRLVVDSGAANRSRWPMQSAWTALRQDFGLLAGVPPLEDDTRRLVRGARYRGRVRLLRRMEAGVIRSLEVEDASPTSAALHTLARWMERIAEKEVARLTARCARYEQAGKPIPRWVRAGMDERFWRVQRVEARLQMLL